jgi:hypothetical protein
MHARTRPTLYEQLLALPEGLTGEILAGQLHAQPRPSGPHGLAGSVLGMRLGVPFQLGGGGPGGWWSIDEPELHLIPDTEVLVPDLAGWGRERMPRIPQGHRFTVVPDWWLVDPKARTLEAYALEDGTWREIGRFANGDLVIVAPFDAVSIQLADPWVPV